MIIVLEYYPYYWTEPAEVTILHTPGTRQERDIWGVGGHNFLIFPILKKRGWWHFLIFSPPGRKIGGADKRNAHPDCIFKLLIPNTLIWLNKRYIHAKRENNTRASRENSFCSEKTTHIFCADPIFLQNVFSGRLKLIKRISRDYWQSWFKQSVAQETQIGQVIQTRGRLCARLFP